MAMAIKLGKPPKDPRETPPAPSHYISWGRRDDEDDGA